MSFSISSPARYPELDGLRGIAILLTILCNTPLTWGLEVPEYWRRISEAGWIGVQLFFVLSGFLITTILLDSRGDRHFFRNFYARRALRIFPAYFLFLAIVLSIFWIIRGESTPHNPLCYALFVSNACIVASHSWGEFVGVTWSLAVEEHFYLVWPLLVALLSMRSLVLATCAIIAGSLLLRYGMVAANVGPVPIYVLTPTRLDGLAAGALIAVAIYANFAAPLINRIGGPMLAAGLFAMAAVATSLRSFGYELPAVATVGYTALTVACAGAVLVSISDRARDQRLRRALRARWLMAAGFYSYGMYLYHPFVAHALHRIPIFATVENTPINIWAQFAFTTTVVVLTFVIAVASYHLFEAKFLALRRYFPRRTSDVPEKSAAAATTA